VIWINYGTGVVITVLVVILCDMACVSDVIVICCLKFINLSGDAYRSQVFSGNASLFSWRVGPHEWSLFKILIYNG
jgi:hypothetical protein